MPLVGYRDRTEYYDSSNSRKTYAYLSGERLKRYDARALQYDSRSWGKWCNGSLFPPLKSFLWIIPSHALLISAIFMVITAETVPGRIWMAICAAGIALMHSSSWKQIYINSIIVRMKKRLVIDDISQDRRFNALKNHGYSETSSVEDFSLWLHNQLCVNAPFFGRVHKILDEYLDATEQAARLYKSLNYEKKGYYEAGDLIKAASDIAYQKLLPIYRRAMDDIEHNNREEMARVAAQTTYQANEEERLTDMRLSIAQDSVGRYVQSHHTEVELHQL